MKLNIKKSISLILSIIMLVSVFSVVSFAGADPTDIQIITATNKADLENLDRDIPVVEIVGLGETLYKGLLAYDEENYQQIFAPTADMILKGIGLGGIELASGLINDDYDKVADALAKAVIPIFGDLKCDENGVPDPNTGIKDKNRAVKKSEYGYDNSYTFYYDWRLDMHTLSVMLDEYINKVLEVTGEKQVVLTAFSMGNCILTTYLYEYYYNNPDYASRNHIAACIYISGAMNGVACCGEPFSGNLSLDAESVMRMVSDIIVKDGITGALYTALEALYTAGFVKDITDFGNKIIDATMDKLVDAGAMDSLGTIPGFYALMSYDDYYRAEEFVFNTPEKREQYKGLIEKNRYYHECVQKINDEIIEDTINNGIKVGIISEYGYTMTPTSVDNDRMADGVITTECESFGATCAPVDGILGKDYVQAVDCICGNNHISPDLQIDASTCRFADITWFIKNIRHSSAAGYLKDLVDLIAYSEETVDVFTFADFPQFMIKKADDSGIEAQTAENVNPDEILPFEQTTFIARIIAFFKNLIAFFKNLVK